MRPRLLLFASAFVLIFTGHAHCEDLSQLRLLFYQANDDYSSSKYADAISAYEKIPELGYESGPLYYNLGNAYFKEGSLGKAIVNYMRAKNIMPEDADLKSNLNYARSNIKGGVVFPKTNFISRIFFNLADSFSLERITVYSTILYVVISVLLIIMILAKRLRRPLAYIVAPMFITLVLGVGIFYVRFSAIAIQRVAIVTAKSIDAAFEPFDDATVFFTLNEGEPVVVIAEKGEWIKIRRADKRSGWIKKRAIEHV